jgi:putative spermidine/putrescine transport system ATP-binding protein
VQLDHLATRSISALSGGQRQRVALARAVVFSPRIVLMDEPLSALDKNLREQMQVEIRHLHQRIGATTIYVTHDQREALTMSDRVAVMNLGRLVQCATPAEIYEHPANAFVAGFIGETALVDVTAGPAGEVMMADGTRLAVATRLPAGALVLALRAERLLLPGEYGDDCNRIPARLREVIYQGDSLLLLAEIARSQTVSIRKPLRGPPGAAQPWRAGDAIVLGLSPASTIVVPR